MFRGKRSNIWHAVGNLTADGVVVGESGIRTDMLTDVVHNSLESIQGLGGLRKETDVLVEIKAVDLLRCLDNDGCAVGLSYKSQYLGMTVLSEDDNLLAMIFVSIVFPFYPFLQVKYNGTCGVDNIDVVLLSLLVCAGALRGRATELFRCGVGGTAGDQ